jgi:shikimate dehydrogenase
MTITAKTKLVGVIGNPVRHSLSPLLHNHWCQQAGIDAVYLAFEPTVGGFGDVIEGLKGAGALGVNVTVPFKERAFKASGTASPLATRCGAANTLVFSGDNVHCDNTDGVGLLSDLDRRAPGWRDRPNPVVILGVGGAARGIGAALLDAGRTNVQFVARRLDQAQLLCIGLKGGTANAWETLGRVSEGASLLINATPRGLNNQDPLDLDLSPFAPDAVVYDTVYAPRETALLKAARDQGFQALDGLGMLVSQAALAFQHWFGVLPDIDEGMRVLTQALEGHSP